MGATFTVAREVTAVLHKRGLERDVDAKRVRAWVRDNVDAYDDDGYTAHLYDARLRDRIVSGMVARYVGRTPGTTARAASASAGRSPAKVKATSAPTTPHKAPPVRAMGSGPVTRSKAAPVAPEAPDAS
jgi:hypothetical protein